MASSFNQWETDPFFSAAEEVQESADRMISLYRLWIQEGNTASKATTGAGTEFTSRELQRELHVSLGTAKWQLEDLGRAVRLNDDAVSVGDDTRDRHRKFIAAIRSMISTVEDSLRQSNFESTDSAFAWIRLDGVETDELARFLSGPVPEEEISAISLVHGSEAENKTLNKEGEDSSVCFKNSLSHSNETGIWEARQETLLCEPRAESSNAGVGSWIVDIARECNDAPRRSQDDTTILPSPSTLSFAGLANTLNSSPRMRWFRNGLRKWRIQFQDSTSEYLPFQNYQLSQGMDACYMRSKSCLNNCCEDIDHKQLYGYLGAFHRRLQRSQYQIQYARPIQIILWATIFILLIGKQMFFTSQSRTKTLIGLKVVSSWRRLMTLCMKTKQRSFSTLDIDWPLRHSAWICEMQFSFFAAWSSTIWYPAYSTMLRDDFFSTFFWYNPAIGVGLHAPLSIFHACLNRYYSEGLADHWSGLLKRLSKSLACASISEAEFFTSSSRCKHKTSWRFCGTLEMLSRQGNLLCDGNVGSY